MQFDHILIPTDFSAHAQKAVETAVQLGKAFNSSIHLLHAYYFEVPPTYLQGDAAAFTNPQLILDPIRDHAQASMEALIKDVAQHGLSVEGTVLFGPASEVILGQAAQIPADAIVMGTRGLTGLKHVFLGSTAERVVRMAPCPVLTVKAEDAEDAEAGEEASTA